MGGPQPVPLNAIDGDALVTLAIQAIRQRLCNGPLDDYRPAIPSLHRPGCSFVTIENAGRLRGCIGSLQPVRPLYRDVACNARRATADPRMSPVLASEWPALSISVSVLGVPEPLPAWDLADLYRWLRPQVDGLIIGVGDREVTFLPSVWAVLPDPAEFVAALLTKGGWPADRLPPGARLNRYAATVFHAPAGRRPAPGEIGGAVPR